MGPFIVSCHSSIGLGMKSDDLVEQAIKGGNKETVVYLEVCIEEKNYLEPRW